MFEKYLDKYPRISDLRQGDTTYTELNGEKVKIEVTHRPEGAPTIANETIVRVTRPDGTTGEAPVTLLSIRPETLVKKAIKDAFEEDKSVEEGSRLDEIVQNVIN